MAHETPAPDASSSPNGEAERESSLIEAARRQALRREAGDVEPSSGPFGDLLQTSLPQQIGRYRIRRRISSGGMGTVYEAEQDAPRRTVAIKVIHAGEMSPRALRRFEHETRLLARRRPHQLRGKSIPQALRTIAQEEPPRLGSLDRSLRGDVDTLVAKAMEKDRQERYQSAAEFAADIRRYLHGEPIQARPIGRLGRLWRWSRRQPRVAALVALLLTLLVVMAVGSTGAALWIAAARRAEQDALRQARELGERRRRNLYAAQMNLAMMTIAFAPDGSRLALAGWSQQVVIWDVTEERVRAAFIDPSVGALAFSPDGELLATANRGDGCVRLWNTRTGQDLDLLRGHTGAVNSIAFDPSAAASRSQAGRTPWSSIT